MKVVSAREMARVEALAVADGASERDFMNRAGRGIATVVAEFILTSQTEEVVTLLCGKGNNAGDAYVVGRELQAKGFSVKALQLFPIDTCSPLCQENYHNFVNEGGEVVIVQQVNDVYFPGTGVIVDGLLGTGFRGTVDGALAWMIARANESELPIIAIDIPSGLNGNTGLVEGIAIRATQTVFLGLPKTGFFIQDGWNHVGKLRYVDFGLDPKYIEEASADFFELTKKYAGKLLPPIERTRHKYSAGYVVGLAGSKNYPGAATLSGWASLRSGAGIVRILYPEDAQLAHTPYELIKEVCNIDHVDSILEIMNKASACFLGPGIGTTANTKKLILHLCNHLTPPTVFDADALNLVSGESAVLFPQHTLITPHIGEMRRLLQTQNRAINIEFLTECQKFSNEKRLTIILKGGPTFIFHPHSIPIVSGFGNPGMATAGTGDVLTGIVTALLSQKMTPKNAAMLGIYLHGTSGDNAAKEKTEYSLIASDIIEWIPQTLKQLMHNSL